MTNYPPGTSAGDPRAPWNAPDRSHEHEWESDFYEVEPVIEDGAAIFHEECQYAEGRYGDGWQCEEERTYRFEYSGLESPDGEIKELYDITEWDKNDDGVAEKVVRIEQAVNDEYEETSIEVDPDPDCGHVTIEHKGWKLHYEA